MKQPINQQMQKLYNLRLPIRSLYSLFILIYFTNNYLTIFHLAPFTTYCNLFQMLRRAEPKLPTYKCYSKNLTYQFTIFKKSFCYYIQRFQLHITQEQENDIKTLCTYISSSPYKYLPYQLAYTQICVRHILLSSYVQYIVLDYLRWLY